MDLLEFLVVKLCSAVMDGEIQLGFEQHFIEKAGADGNAASWLHPSSKGGIQLARARASFAAGATLLRVLACHQFGLDCTAVGDEQVDRSLALAVEFIKLNATVATGGGGGGGTTAGGIGAAGAKSAKQKKAAAAAKVVAEVEESDNEADMDDEPPSKPVAILAASKAKAKLGTRRLMQEVGRIFLPLLSSLLQALPAVLHSRRQGDRLIISSYELAFSVLKLDQTLCSRVDLLDPTTGQLLINCHKSAISVLVAVSKRYSTHRSAIIQEHLQLFSETLTVKNPSKTFSLGQKSNRGSDSLGGKSISMSTAALCMVLQGIVAHNSMVSINGELSNDLQTELDRPSPSKDVSLSEAEAPAKAGKRRKIDSSSTPSPAKKDVALEAGSNGKLGFFSPPASDKGSELSKACMADVQRLVNVFVSDLISRCAHKDLFAEYRTAVVAFINELLRALSCPTFPVLPMILEALVRRLLNDVTAEYSDRDKGDGDKASAKKDSSHTNFLMDLLGTLAAGIRSVTLAAEKQRDGASGATLDEVPLTAVREKIDALKPSWMKEFDAEKHELTKPDAGPLAAKKAGAKSSKQAASSSSQKMFLSLDLAIKILDQVSALTLDALSQHTTADDDFVVTGHVPAPILVLRQLGSHEDLLLCLPPVMNRDQCAQTVCDYLRSLVLKTIVQADATSSCKGAALEYEFVSSDEYHDIYLSALAQWHKDAVTAGRTKAVKYVHKLLCRGVEKISGGSAVTTTSSSTGSGTSSSGSSSAASFTTEGLELESWRTALSSEWATAAYRSLLTDRLLATEYDRIITALLMLLAEPMPVIRARVLKTFASIMKVDSDLISMEAVRETVNERFNDCAISVREEAVKLVGGYVARGYDLSQGYLPGLLQRLRDKGVSVRKAVVGIFRELLLYQPSHPQYSQLCIHLLERSAMPKEEDTIKDVIRSTFQKIWFLPPTDQAVHSSAKPKRQLMAHAGKSRAGASGGGADNEAHGVDNDGDYDEGGGDAGDDDDDDEGERDEEEDDESRRHQLNLSAVKPGTAAYVDLKTWGDDYFKSLGLPKQGATSTYVVQGIYGAVRGRKIELSFPVFDEVQRVDERYVKQHGSLSRLSPRHVLIDAAFCLRQPQIFLEVDDSGITREQHLNRLTKSGSDSGALVASTLESAAPALVSAPSAAATRVNMSKALQEHTETTAMQMIDVVSNCDQLDWMVSLIREMLHGKGQGYEVQGQVLKRRKQSHTHCAKVVSCLFEMLVRAEEQDPRLVELMKKTIGREEGSAARLRTQKEQVVATIATLGVFCEAHPPLMLQHLDSLLPYLKGDAALTAEQETSITLTVMNIISSAVMIKGAQFTLSMDELNSDLTNIALKYKLTCINAAVGCMATITAHVTGNATSYMQLADKCFNAIASVAKSVTAPQNVSEAQGHRVQRSLVVLGAVCEHSRKCMDALKALEAKGRGSPASGGKSFPKTLADEQMTMRQYYDKEEAIAAKPITDIERILPTAVNGCCYSAAIYALSLPYEQIQGRAAQALCNVFVGTFFFWGGIPRGKK